MIEISIIKFISICISMFAVGILTANLIFICGTDIKWIAYKRGYDKGFDDGYHFMRQKSLEIVKEIMEERKKNEHTN